MAWSSWVLGGKEGSAWILSSAEVYDPRRGSWTAAEGMAVARIHHTATLLSDGGVLISGGGSGTMLLGPGF